jgi:glycosyltransferase involved in cell wall biosynthesis
MDKRIKIAQVIYGLKFGGAEKLLIPLSTKLNPRKFKVMVVALTCGGPVEDELKRQGVDVRILRHDGRFGLLELIRLIRILKKGKFDIVHTHLQNADLWAGLAANFCRIRHVSTFHGEYFKKTLTEFLKQRLRVILPDKIIAVSQSTARHCIARLGAKADKIVVIYNGVEVDAYDIALGVAAKRKEMGISETAVVLGAFGRLEIEKGHRYLIKALSLLKMSYSNIVTLIVGIGSLGQELVEMAQGLGLKKEIRFLGERSDIPELLKIVDIVVSPSLSEGLSISCLEAMAAARLVVATEVGGIPELIEDKQSGVLVESGNPLSLAKVISSVIENKVLAQRLGLQARERVKVSFSIDKMIDKTASLYEELVHSNPIIT